MARPGIGPDRWDLGWTAEELAESYDELSELEPLFVPITSGDVTAPEPERGGIEVVAIAEARGPRDVAVGETAVPPSASGADAETYAVLPVVEALVAIASYGVPEPAPDENVDERASDAPAFLA